MSAISVQTGSGPLIAALPFTPHEYESRLAALRRRMAAEGLDVFVAFAPENIFYLTGHDTPAYHYLQASIVTATGMPVNVLRSIDASNTLENSWSRQAVLYGDSDDPVAVLANVLADLAPTGATIGLEDESFFVTPKRHAALVARLTAAGQTIVGRQLVEDLRLIKSAEEMAHIRKAAGLTQAAMRAAIAVAAEGVSENTIAAAVWTALVEGGGEFPGLPPFIVSGPRTSLGHATWAGRRLQQGDSLAFEIPGVVHRYVGPMFRCGSVGTPSAEVRALEAAAIASLEILTEAMRPGMPIDALHRLSVENFARRGFTLGHRSGYSVGVNYAPDWGEGNALSIRDGETRTIEAGMVFHLVPGIYVPGRHVVVISDTVAVTETGCERITDFPRELFVV